MIFDGKTLKDLYADIGQSGMDLRESEDIKERWQEYTEELYKMIFTTQIIMTVWLLIWSQTSWNVKSSGP